MNNPAPFQNIHSFKVSVEVTDEGTFAVDHSTGERFLCCPKCHEPYGIIQDFFARGCMNKRCSEYKDENWPHWEMTENGPVLVNPIAPHILRG